MTHYVITIIATLHNSNFFTLVLLGIRCILYHLFSMLPTYFLQHVFFKNTIMSLKTKVTSVMFIINVINV